MSDLKLSRDKDLTHKLKTVRTGHLEQVTALHGDKQIQRCENWLYS